MRRIELRLKTLVKLDCSQRTLSCGRKHLYVFYRRIAVCGWETVYAQIYRQLHCRVEVEPLHEEKVLRAAAKVGHFTLYYAVGVGDYRAGLSLTENLGQSNNRNGSAEDNIMQDVSRSDRRKLVAVPHHNKLAVDVQRAQKRLEQEGVHHRHLVYYNGVAVERVAFVVLKGYVIAHSALYAQKAVNRLRLVTGKVGNALCGSACRRAYEHPVALLL